MPIRTELHRLHDRIVRKRFAQRTSGASFPDSHRVVFGSGRDPLPIGAEIDGPDPILVVHLLTHRLQGFDIPKGGEAIMRTGGHVLPVQTEPGTLELKLFESLPDAIRGANPRPKNFYESNLWRSDQAGSVVANRRKSSENGAVFNEGYHGPIGDMDEVIFSEACRGGR